MIRNLIKTLLLITAFFSSLVTLPAQESWIEIAQKKLAKATNDIQRFNVASELINAYVYNYPDSAIPYIEQAMLFANKIKSDSVFAVAYGLQSLYATLTGNYPMALKYQFQALQHAEETGDRMLIANCYLSLADICLVQGDYGRGVFYGEKAKAIYDAFYSIPSGRPKEFHDTLVYYANTVYKLTEAYEKNGQLDSVLKYLPIVELGWSWREMWPTFYLAYGNVYRKKGDYLKAVGYYHAGIIAAGHYKIKKDLMDIYNGLALTWSSLGQLDSSIYYYKKILETSNSTINPAVELKALESLAKAYIIKNNTDSISKYSVLALATKDSLFNQQKQAQVQKIVFDELIRQQELQDEQQKRLYQYRLFSLSGGLLVLAFIAVILYRNNRHKQKSKLEIERAYGILKSTQAQLIQSEKMASLGELTAGIAHEIQNPLNFMNNFSDVNKDLLLELSEEIDKGNFDDAKLIAADVISNEEKINHHGKRADSIVKGMLQHTHKSTGEKVSTDINALADEYLRLAFHGMRARDKSFNAALKTEFDASAGNINIVPQDIGRVLLNLYNNAFQSLSDKARNNPGYNPEIFVGTNRNKGLLHISVKDNGVGIPEKIVSKIFQPFFTTKPTGQGTGLGLSLAYDAIKSHGGEINIRNLEEGGAEFTIILPVGT